jgi:hypothetical protein
VWISLRTRDQEEAERLFQTIKYSPEFHHVISLQDLSQWIQNYAKMNYKKGTVELYRISFEHFITSVGNRPLRLIAAMDTESFKEYLLQRVRRVSANVYLRSLKTISTLQFALS